MAPTVTRIDRSLPVCWEDPATLRIGFDRAELTLSDPSPGTQRLIAALKTGVRADRLNLTLERARANRDEWHRLVEQLGSAIIDTEEPVVPPPPRPLRVGLISSGEATAESFLVALGQAAMHGGRFAPGAGWDLVIVIERFLEPPTSLRLEASGIPQLAVRFSDRSVRVGPLVSATGRPCLSCVTLHDVDRDPALPAVAAQLLGSVPATESAAAADLAAAIAVMSIRQWQAGDDSLRETRLHFAVRDGLPLLPIKQERMSAHASCACGLNAPQDSAVGEEPGLGDESRRNPRGTGSARAP